MLAMRITLGLGLSILLLVVLSACRPSGEQRLSNFLLWQSAYAEFLTSSVLWPDFRKQHLFEALAEYQKRNRRYGGL